MKSTAQAFFPKDFFRDSAHFRALLLGCFYLLILLLQLFTFEDFYKIVSGFALPGGSVAAVIMTGAFPLFMAAGLPYLFSMRLNERAWHFSRIMAIVSPLTWFVVVLYLGISGNILAEVGIFGATVVIHYSWWVVVLLGMIALSAILVARELPRRHA